MRKVLVTAGAAGIGKHIAAAFLAAGDAVYTCDINEDALKAAAVDLPGLKTGGCNIGDRAQIEHMVADAAAQLGGIDVLVNNAGGLGSVRPLWEQTSDETARTIALNLTAPLQLMQAVLPGMIARGQGHVVNLCSIAGQGALAGTTTYGAAKAGLAQAGRGLRFDLAGSNIRITDIAPGRVETEFYLTAFGGDAATLKDRMYERQRALTAGDIAQVVLAALHLPARANITELTILPTDQALGGHVYPDRSDA